jgi:agmatine/peptidylarginine deiminase
MLENPFENAESKKSSHTKSEKGFLIESKKSPDVIEEYALDRKIEKILPEREIGHINNTKIIKSNNNIKQMKLLLCDLNFGKIFIENIFENYELLNISISTHRFSELTKSKKNEFEFDPLNSMTEILEKNEKLIERFYNVFIYDEKII